MTRPSRPLALVTGASRGIGKAIAHALAPDHDLVVSGRDASTLELVADELRSAAGASVELIVADLGGDEGRAAVLDQVQSHAWAVRVLVNNAGVALSAPLHRTSTQSFSEVMAVNLTAPFELARGLVPDMVKAGWGRIINVASTAALKGYRYTTAYAASKAGLVGLTRALATELAQTGVTVNAVCPGFVDTAIVADAIRTIRDKTGRTEAEARSSLERFSPQGRILAPEEIAGLVAYLASEPAAGVTGQAIAIDGGETA